MNDNLRDMELRIKINHVKKMSVESSPGFQGPYSDTLYYYQNDDGTYIVQNGDQKIIDMPASDLFYLTTLIAMQLLNE